MPSTFTSNHNLEKIADGEQEDTWGASERANQDKLDDILGGYLAKSVAGGTDVTLTEAEYDHRTIELTGLLTGNISVIFPAKQRVWRVFNNTTGSFTLTCKVSGQTGFPAIQGKKYDVTCDGTDVSIHLSDETLALSGGGTGATSAAAARTNLDVPGLGANNAFTGDNTYSGDDTHNGTLTVNSALVNLVGLVHLYIGASAPAGYLLVNGDTLGDTGSGATHAGSQFEPLYTLIYDNMADSEAPVSGGRGASAAADFAAGKTLTMPDGRGRAAIMAGTGAGLTARTLGDATIGSEDAIVVSHSHGPGTLATDSQGAHQHDIKVDVSAVSESTLRVKGVSDGEDTDGSLSTETASVQTAGAHTHSVNSGTTASAGSSGTGANMIPVIVLNLIVKY